MLIERDFTRGELRLLLALTLGYRLSDKAIEAVVGLPRRHLAERLNLIANRYRIWQDDEEIARWLNEHREEILPPDFCAGRTSNFSASSQKAER
jgi:hypothetical protein